MQGCHNRVLGFFLFCKVCKVAGGGFLIVSSNDSDGWESKELWLCVLSLGGTDIFIVSRQSRGGQIALLSECVMLPCDAA